VNEEYELALLVRKWMGEVLSPKEDLTLNVTFSAAGTHYSELARNKKIPIDAIPKLDV